MFISQHCKIINILFHSLESRSGTLTDWGIIVVWKNTCMCNPKIQNHHTGVQWYSWRAWLAGMGEQHLKSENSETILFVDLDNKLWEVSFNNSMEISHSSFLTNVFHVGMLVVIKGCTDSAWMFVMQFRSFCCWRKWIRYHLPQVTDHLIASPERLHWDTLWLVKHLKTACILLMLSGGCTPALYKHICVPFGLFGVVGSDFKLGWKLYHTVQVTSLSRVAKGRNF